MAKTMAKGASAKAPLTKGPQSEGVADAEGSQSFEPGFGDYDMVFTKAVMFTPEDHNDDSGRGSARYTFPLEIEGGEAEDGEDITGRHWFYTIFITKKPNENMDEDEAKKVAFRRRMDLNKIKDIFKAAGVPVTKDSKGFDVWDPEAFVGKTIQVKVKPVLDKETGEMRVSEKTGTPWKNIYVSKGSAT